MVNVDMNKFFGLNRLESTSDFTKGKGISDPFDLDVNV